MTDSLQKVLPLKNKTIVLTRSTSDSKDSVDRLKELGAHVISFPTIEIVPTNDWTNFDSVINNFAKIDFLIFTSSNAVKHFSARCNSLGFSLSYAGKKIIAVGKKTSTTCARYNIPVDIIPDEFSTDGIIGKLLSLDIKNKNIFIPASAAAGNELSQKLNEAGANVINIPIYDIAIPSDKILISNLAILKASKPDLFIFTSPSTFKNYLSILKISEPEKYFSCFDISAIGSTTKAEIEKYKVKVTILPKEYTMDNLIDSIVKYYNK